MKRNALALTLVLALIASMIVGVTIVHLGKAQRGNVTFVPLLTASNSVSITFTVVASPSVVDQGQTSTLSVSGLFGGTPPYSYQWFEMAPSGSYAAVGTNSTSFSFVTSGSNSLPPVTATGNWSFILQVTDDTGAAVNSTAATVLVNLALVSPSTSASPGAVDQGQTANLNSSIVSTGTSPYTYQWYSRVNQSSYSYVSGATSSSYNFSTSGATARGTWSFVLQVTDNAGAATNSTATTVMVNPTLTAPTVTVAPGIVIQGQTSRLTSTNFSPTGTFPFTYQWFEMSPGGSYAAVGTGIPNFSFVTSNSTATGGWSFILQITDSTAAAMNSTAASVTVNVAPSVSVSPGSANLVVDQTQVFTATPSGGSGNYTFYQWFVNGASQGFELPSTFSFAAGSVGVYLITATVSDNSSTTSAQSPAATVTVSAAATPTPTPVPTQSPTPSPTQSPTPTPTSTQSTAPPSPTATPTITSSSSPSPSPSLLPIELTVTGVVAIGIVAVAIGAFLLGKRAERNSKRTADFQI